MRRLMFSCVDSFSLKCSNIPRLASMRTSKGKKAAPSARDFSLWQIQGRSSICIAHRLSLQNDEQSWLVKCFYIPSFLYLLNLSNHCETNARY